MGCNLIKMTMGPGLWMTFPAVSFCFSTEGNKNKTAAFLFPEPSAQKKSGLMSQRGV